jgi:hypothetical protein
MTKSIDQAMEKSMPMDSGGVPPKEMEKEASKKSKVQVAAEHHSVVKKKIKCDNGR